MRSRTLCLGVSVFIFVSVVRLEKKKSEIKESLLTRNRDVLSHRASAQEFQYIQP